jgi:hypothetical protein
VASRSKKFLDAATQQNSCHTRIRYSFIFECTVRADVGDEETVDALDGIIESTLLYCIEKAPLSREAFTLDNYELLQFLVSWTSGGTAEPHVDLHKETQNGRLAWLCLEDSYEGADSRQERIRNAHQKIRSSYFEREQQSYTFEDYCTRFLQASLELKDLKPPNNPEVLAGTFMDQITCEAMNLHKLVVTNDTACKNNLLQTITKLQSLWNISRPVTNLKRNNDSSIHTCNIGFQAHSTSNGGRGND